MKYCLETHPIKGIQQMPTEPEELTRFYSRLNPQAVVTKCDDENCPNFGNELEYKETCRFPDGAASYCRVCKKWHNGRPPIFRQLKGTYADLNDCLIYMLNGCSSKSILKNCPTITAKTLGSLKLRFDATILKGDETVAVSYTHLTLPTILLV